MKQYIVITPVYETWYSYDEPPEYGCDVVIVEAQCKADAKVFSIKTKEFRDWVEYQRLDNANPLSGLKVEEYNEETDSEVYKFF